MKKTILNRNLVDNKTQPLFLGEDLSIQRYDDPKYPIFVSLFDKQTDLFWTPNEFNLAQDKTDFKNMNENERFIFTSNLQYQTLLDSVISRGVPILMDHVTNTELETCMSAWAFYENIHSKSYSTVIQAVYPSSSEIFDGILQNVEIMKRAEVASQQYDNLKFGTRDIKEQIYLTLISVNVLEALRFYVSFVCSFAFAENKKMIGNAKIISKIRADEAIHLTITKSIIDILQKEKDEGFVEVAKDLAGESRLMFIEAAQQEKDWATHLFKNGAIIGLNEHILHGYIEWLTDSRLTNIGFEKEFNTKNPIGGWVNNWMNPSSTQQAPQETELDNAYKIGASVNDVDTMNFDFLN
ncbi:MAG TPA: ribonucleotide-diphosphate reductase subunit beta [Chitinophagaceae bacterium]|nr:ribonucleotide-diphosphate reductase subunit beta [Chitinophagaceae bacterium]